MDKSYDIRIPNDEIEKYVTMKAIIDVYNERSGNNTSRQTFIKFLKKIPIVKKLFK
jgi:hypothetical protein